MTLEELYNIILTRKKQMPKDSYVASLFRKGEDYIAQKVGEEAIEVIIASRKDRKKETISEIADLFFHLLVLMAYFDIEIEDIYKELEKRRK